MINVVDEVLSGEPKYTITHADSTTEEVSIDLSTAVTTEGTPLNKALFDSIKSDIQDRLLIASKATNNDMYAGVNNAFYVTPAKVQKKLDDLATRDNISHSGTTATSYTLIDYSLLPEISGVIKQNITVDLRLEQGSGTRSKIIFAGTDIRVASSQEDLSSASTTEVELDFWADVTRVQVMHLDIDCYAKTFTANLYRKYGELTPTTSVVETITGSYDTISTITASINGDTTATYSIKYNSYNPDNL